MKKLAMFTEMLKSPRAKKWIAIVLAAVLALWVIYRFAAFFAMERQRVFNAARMAADQGTPVAVIQVARSTGTLREPIAIRHNRAMVSGARAHLLRAGMRVGDGQIVSVSSGIDLDTGMYVVHTRGVADGLQMAEFVGTGYFIPLSAVNNGVVMVVRDGVAVRTPVHVTRADADTALVAEGLADGDMVIVSHVADGAKVQVQNQVK